MITKDKVIGILCSNDFLKSRAKLVHSCYYSTHSFIMSLIFCPYKILYLTWVRGISDKNEAQEREERQTKQMQEVKSAYEQQNRKLSEFVDFVKRYFPYVEKLMPTIKFLRETLNFGDAVIRKLCTFKDVSIRGELYSCEFNQHFKADGAVCSY